MMRARTITALLVALTATACGGPPAPPVGARQDPLLLAQPARFWRFYTVVTVDPGGLLAQRPCDDPPLPPPVAALGLHIESSPLFDTGRAVAPPGGEAVYCQHVTAVSAADVQVITDSAPPPGDIELVPRRVVPQGVAADRARQAGAARFVALAGVPTARPAAAVPTTVAVLDTAARAAADGLPGLGAHDPHGEDMALLVRQGLCPDNSAPEDCGFFVETLPALDLVEDGYGLMHAPGGGTFGDVGQVARAIHRAVDDAAVAGRRLVIDLSLAWPAGQQQRASVRAARAAIEQARAQGAVVIAAAGNDDLCGVPLPAAWRDVPAADGAPLVVSAAAVDARGASVGNAQSAAAAVSTARAYGDGVVADPRFLTPGPAAIAPDGHAWTGSSVAAAVTAAAAAARLARGDQPAAVVAALGHVDDPAPALPRRDLLRICAFAGAPCPPLGVEPLDLGALAAVKPPPLAGRGGAVPEDRPMCDDGMPGSAPTCEVCFGVSRQARLLVLMDQTVRNAWLRIDDGAPRYLRLGDTLLVGKPYLFEVSLPAAGKVELMYQHGADGRWYASPVSMHD